MENSYRMITMSTGKKLFVFDNLIPMNEMIRLSCFAQNSSFKLDGRTMFIQEQPAKYLKCIFTDEDAKNWAILRNPMPEISKILNGRKPIRHWLLFNDLSTKIYYHHDSPKELNCMSFLYYVNTEWLNHWGGDTIFADDNGEAEIAVSCKPGRVVLFDSSILHKVSPISHDAPFRYTFNMIFQ
jgi:hypothetical protein